MQDILDVIKNVETLYSNNSSLGVLKDFERVLDEMDLYVYKNWEDGELAQGPTVSRHWVTASFMWPHKNMPDPRGGERLLDYGCKVSYEKTHLIKPREIKSPDDFRPGTKKGKLDREPVWVVEIEMPKKLITDIYDGYMNKMKDKMNIDTARQGASQSEAADNAAAGATGSAIAAAPQTPSAFGGMTQ